MSDEIITDGYIVDKDKLEQAYDDIQALLLEQFGVDQDLDGNVEFILIDRQRYWPMHYQPVPYDHKEPRRALEMALMNLQIAADAVDVMLRIQRYDERLKMECCEGKMPEEGKGGCNECDCRLYDWPDKDREARWCPCRYHVSKKRLLER